MTAPSPEVAKKEVPSSSQFRGAGFPRPFWDVRVLRRFWLDTFSQVADAYLRSDAFLGLVHASLGPRTVAPEQPVLSVTSEAMPAPRADAKESEIVR